jgi:hypothetical protein
MIQWLHVQFEVPPLLEDKSRERKHPKERKSNREGVDSTCDGVTELYAALRLADMFMSGEVFIYLPELVSMVIGLRWKLCVPI